MTLYLLPNLLHERANPKASLVPIIEDLIYDFDGFYVETPKIARVFLKNFDFSRLRDVSMEIIAKRAQVTREIIEPLKRGEKWGVICDAGLPCIADPGSRVVSLAREAGVNVIAFPGPCSVTHALSVSGLDGNGFTFHGYFPKHAESSLFKQPGIHIFIETPYNNCKAIKTAAANMSPNDIICVACDLMSDTEEVEIRKASNWNSEELIQRFHKRPAIIILQVQ